MACLKTWSSASEPFASIAASVSPSTNSMTMKSVPSCEPTSCSVQYLGGSNREIAGLRVRIAAVFRILPAVRKHHLDGDPRSRRVSRARTPRPFPGAGEDDLWSPVERRWTTSSDGRRPAASSLQLLCATFWKFSWSFALVKARRWSSGRSRTTVGMSDVQRIVRVRLRTTSSPPLPFNDG